MASEGVEREGEGFSRRMARQMPRLSKAKTRAIEKMLNIERMLPKLPILRMLPVLPMLKILPALPIERMLPTLPMLKMLA